MATRTIVRSAPHSPGQQSSISGTKPSLIAEKYLRGTVQKTARAWKIFTTATTGPSRLSNTRPFVLAPKDMEVRRPNRRYATTKIPKLAMSTRGYSALSRIDVDIGSTSPMPLNI
eukprot:CAMPEP_0170194526 /NCGR_PEP_ID=MMETSP0040_2-20121228/59494_1 /TAXON_ID=641309 /ORGANISM="Lotharella oceanica, Strain CCMP622" /LENGTH=114 /DNA_ID=CAMNT_0010443467 /DNA_START=193 /DNA_END=537 /DNA_ORIENTATION=-